MQTFLTNFFIGGNLDVEGLSLYPPYALLPLENSEQMLRIFSLRFLQKIEKLSLLSTQNTENGGSSSVSLSG